MSDRARSPFTQPAFLLVLAILIASGAAFGGLIRLYGFHLQKLEIYPEGGITLPNVPRETASWKQVGSDSVMAKDVIETLGTENYVSRNFVLKEPEPGKTPPVIEFHAAYYTGMIDTVPHVPERCFVGGGLEIGDDLGVVRVPLDGSAWAIDRSVPGSLSEAGPIYTASTSRRFNEQMPGQRLRLPRGLAPGEGVGMKASEFIYPGDRKLYAAYFFIANGGIVARAEGVRALAFDLQSDYAYYLKVQITSASFSTPEAFQEAGGNLISELLPDLMMCIPDWIEVELGNYPEDNPRREAAAN